MSTISAIRPTSPDVASRSIAIRMPDAEDAIEVVQLTVKPVSPGLDAVQRDGHTIGYVQRAGHVFVSLIGERADKAEECGQYLLWDFAAARLSSYRA